MTSFLTFIEAQVRANPFIMDTHAIEMFLMQFLFFDL